jgi:hypothetical protein
MDLGLSSPLASEVRDGPVLPTIKLNVGYSSKLSAPGLLMEGDEPTAPANNCTQGPLGVSIIRVFFSSSCIEIFLPLSTAALQKVKW